jgi:hypothetical protein
MKLTQYINEATKETQWRTNYGTVIPDSLVTKWQQDAERISSRTKKTNEYINQLKSLINQHENSRNI